MDVLAPGLVLHKVFGIVHLANVVEIAADARHQRIRPDLAAGRLRKGRHHHGMVVGAARRHEHLLHDRVVQVAQIHQAEHGRGIQHIFKRRQEAEAEDAGEEAVERDARKGEHPLREAIIEYNLKNSKKNSAQHTLQQRCEHDVDPALDFMDDAGGGQGYAERVQEGHQQVAGGIQHTEGRMEREIERVQLPEKNRHQEGAERDGQDDPQRIRGGEKHGLHAQHRDCIGEDEEEVLRNHLLAGRLFAQARPAEQEEVEHAQHHQVQDRIRKGAVVDVRGGLGHALELRVAFLRDGKALPDDLLALLDGDRVVVVRRQRLVRLDGDVRNLADLIIIDIIR